jgi:hypothetical protein
MKHKIIKMHWSTWRGLLKLYPKLPNETLDNYFRRLRVDIETLKYGDVE